MQSSRSDGLLTITRAGRECDQAEIASHHGAPAADT
jgi:hypothetical protein